MVKYKIRKICVLLLMLQCSFVVWAKSTKEPIDTTRNVRLEVIEEDSVLYSTVLHLRQGQNIRLIDESRENRIYSRFSVGVQIGTDIGAAAPYPVSAMGNGKMEASPKLHLSLGGKVGVGLTPNWSMFVEIDYREIEMSAYAQVTNQRADLGNMVQYFTGIASTHMNFQLLEFPLYVKYGFGKKGTHRILAGPYYAWVIRSVFVNSPVRGYIGSKPDQIQSIIDKESDVTRADFSSLLDSWDAGVLIGYETRIINNLDLGLRFSMGFKDIFKPDQKVLDYKMLQLRGSVVLSYTLYSKKK